MKRRLVACACFCMFACVTVRGEETNDAIYVPLLQPGGPTIHTNELISVRFTNSPLAEVIRYFAERHDVNLIALADRFTNRVTVNLDKVEKKPALEAILETCGFMLIEPSPGTGIYRVVSPHRSVPVWRPFSVIVRAPPGTYYEIYIRTLHKSWWGEPVCIGTTEAGPPQSHRLSAPEESVGIRVKAHGYETWERGVRLLEGGDPEQTFMAALQPDKKK